MSFKIKYLNKFIFYFLALPFNILPFYSQYYAKIMWISEKTIYDTYQKLLWISEVYLLLFSHKNFTQRTSFFGL